MLLMWVVGAVAAAAQEITGAGATFPNPIYSRWFDEYNKLHPRVKINYQSVGSGAGIRQVSEQIIDFGATDSPMTDRQLAASKVKLLHLPTLLGAVVPAYNVPGITQTLKFAPDVIADIYLGKITRWNDARLVDDNPGVMLPNAEIVPVYRSDGSGTTFAFSDYLCKVSTGFSKRIGRGNSVAWPVGVGQKGNEGMAGLVKSGPYTFGYLEMVYAVQTHTAFGAIRNARGNWVKASAVSVTAAVEAQSGSIPADFRASITNADGASSYPIVSFTWLLLPQPMSSAEKGRAMREFLTWMVDRGESEAADMAYVPLPASLAGRVSRTVQQLR